MRNVMPSGLGLLAAVFLATRAAVADDATPHHLITVDADFTGALVEVSEAVLLGAEIAAREINAAGGVNGVPVMIRKTDHRSNPRRAYDNFQEARQDGIVAVISGAHSAGALALLEDCSLHGIPIISAFPASSKITRADLDPNPAFRVSAQDGDVAVYLLNEALKVGYTRFAAIFENSVWGKSNDRGLRAALQTAGRGEIVAEGWFALGGEGFEDTLADALAARPEALIVIGKSLQGVAAINAVAALPANERPVILLHWGTATGADFRKAAAGAKDVEIAVFQTFNFETARDAKRAAQLVEAACTLRNLCDAKDIVNPIGVAQGYDTVHLVAMGLGDVANGDEPSLLAALQSLEPYEGMLKRYAPAFTPTRREALDVDDYMLVRFVDGGRPVPTSLSVLATQ